MDSKVKIDILNNLLEAEYAALEYYRIHAAGIAEEDIAAGVREIIPAEKSHALNLVKRIQELGGKPVHHSGKAAEASRKRGEESKQQGILGMLRLELENEQQAIKDYASPVAEILDDMETLEMLEEQLFDELRHAKWLKKKILELEGKR
jgi:bacterioferritin (cytochrome b1)